MSSARRGSRVLEYALVFLIAVSLNFFLPRLMPGNPLVLLAGVDVGTMTPQERQFPAVIKGSRKRRICQGSGTQVQDLNRLLKQHKQMQKMMKKMKGGGMQKMMRGLGGMMGGPGGGMPPGMPPGGGMPPFK